MVQCSPKQSKSPIWLLFREVIIPHLRWASREDSFCVTQLGGPTTALYGYYTRFGSLWVKFLSILWGIV